MEEQVALPSKISARAAGAVESRSPSTSGASDDDEMDGMARRFLRRKESESGQLAYPCD